MCCSLVEAAVQRGVLDDLWMTMVEGSGESQMTYETDTAM